MGIFVFVLAWLVDFLLLMGVCQMFPCSASFVRMLLAPLVSAGYIILTLQPFLKPVCGVLLGCLTLVFTGIIAFGLQLDGIRNCGVFLLLRFAIAGILQPEAILRPWPLLLISVLVLILCTLGLPEKIGNLVPVELSYGTNRLKVTALRDTGNTLHDPVTGKPVLILGADAAQNLIGLTAQQLRCPIDTMGSIPGLRLIPYRAISGDGLLLALRLSRVRIGSRCGSAVVAFAPEVLSREGKFQALMGGLL